MKTYAFPYVVFLVLLVGCNTQIKEDQLPEVKSEIPSDYDPEERLYELGIVLPEAGNPVANYVNAVQAGNLMFLAGKGPRKPDGGNVTGKLGADLTIEEGYEAARLAGIAQLAVLKAELGNLNRVKRVVKVKGMVNAMPEFTDHPKVVNGYSDLMVAVFGDRGKHARAAVGMGSLPSNIAVEMEMVVEVFD
ncbi:RidA family protein [Lentiprolixibacter aurantiacus]|uniref:RidA family protein n=1 Tax=Lentiprolixibacter aurantiacus TaxID=2993939 RepID=A0AAE3MKN7_9FLAO|nr:RidA family protein [Lentiprolixibacter aurantiacus]